MLMPTIRPLQPERQILLALASKAAVVRFAPAASRPKFSAALLLLISLLLTSTFSGCMVCQNAKRTLRGEPSEFSWRKDRKQSVETYREWADKAWCKQCLEDPELRCSHEYRDGFKDGFVDYVYAGGSGQPPAVPPRKYWNVESRNPGGHQAAAKWFSGFRHGAQVALHEGYRDRATIQISPQMCDSAGTCLAQPSLSIAPSLIDPIPSPTVPHLLPEETVPLEPLPSAVPTTDVNPMVEELPVFQLINPIEEAAQQPIQDNNKKSEQPHLHKSLKKAKTPNLRRKTSSRRRLSSSRQASAAVQHPEALVVDHVDKQVSDKRVSDSKQSALKFVLVNYEAREPSKQPPKRLFKRPSQRPSNNFFVR